MNDKKKTPIRAPEKASDKGKDAKAALKPCGKPQAMEAERLSDADEACDEGVH